MSACPAPPTRLDPFRSGPHSVRDLGGATWRINTIHPGVQPSQLVIQLTQEEDQAITNLLKLHHQEPGQSDEAPPVDSSISNPAFIPSGSTDSADDEPSCNYAQHLKERHWSDTELKAAHTLMSRFSLMGDKFNHNPAASSPSHVPYPNSDDSSKCISGSRVSEDEEPGGMEFRLVVRNAEVQEEYLVPSSPSSDSKVKGRSSVFGPDVKEVKLSDSERDAVHVLLTLWDTAASDIEQ